jgi:exosortase
MKTSAPRTFSLIFNLGLSIGKGGNMNVRERLAEVFCDALGECAVSGSTDDFHGEGAMRRGFLSIVDSHGAVGNTLLAKPPRTELPMSIEYPEREKSTALHRRDASEMLYRWGAVIFSVALLVWFYWFTAKFGASRGQSAGQWIVSAWNPETDYEHGLLFGPLIAGLIAYRFQDLRAVADRGSVWGLVPLFVGIVLYAAAYRTLQPRIAMGGLPFLLWGSAFYLWGWRVAKMLMFPLFFFWLAIPLPSFQQATSGLQVLATAFAHHGAALFGVKTLVQGTMISPASGAWAPLEIAAGCSGIRSLMALLMISAAWAYIAKIALWKKVVLFLSAFPLAIIGNSLRVISIFVIAEYGDAHWARSTWHDWSGLLLFYPISLMLLLAIHSGLEGGLPWAKGKRRRLSRVIVRQTIEGGGL